MNRSIRRHAAQGFTLIELLIVVIIIAILAAIAIPQFANSSNDAQSSALSANLSTMRSAIEMYRVQHRNVYPSVAVSTGPNAGACVTAGGVAGTGAINTLAAFTEQLTYFSSLTGETCSARVESAGINLGPYLRTIPTEQTGTVASGAIAIVSNGNQNPAPAGTTGGYQFDNRTGRLILNTTATDSHNVAYSSY
jgi:prepilin-type N-terminal cleavage/methylation domain-containing protein